MTRVAVSAVSAATAVGDTVAETMSAMLAGQHGFGSVRRFDVSSSPSRRAALREEESDVEELVARVMHDLTDRDEIAVDRAYFAGEPNGPFPALPVSVRLPEGAREESGWDRVYTGACVASSSALMDAAAAVSAGRARSVLVVAARLIDDGTFFPFASASAMTKDDVTRPFSTGRSGLLLGDGAAAFLLEGVDGGGRSSSMPLAEVRGWGRAGDGHHVCQPEPFGRGMVSAIRTALDRAGLDAEDIDYVSVHGTSTRLNDAAETSALETVFGDALAETRISSAKSAIGHTLEAAGLVEAAIGVQAITESVVPPNLGRRVGDDMLCAGVIEQAVQLERLEHVLSLNLAFGGSNTALVLSRWDAG